VKSRRRSLYIRGNGTAQFNLDVHIPLLKLYTSDIPFHPINLPKLHYLASIRSQVLKYSLQSVWRRLYIWCAPFPRSWQCSISVGAEFAPSGSAVLVSPSCVWCEISRRYIQIRLTASKSEAKQRAEVVAHSHLPDDK
jgi:hypothetical protein